MVDAAGAIYVIGGRSSGDTFFGLGFGINYKDVWVSTDGGARLDSLRGGVGGYHRGYLQRYYRVLRGYWGY